MWEKHEQVETMTIFPLEVKMQIYKIFTLAESLYYLTLLP